MCMAQPAGPPLAVLQAAGHQQQMQQQAAAAAALLKPHMSVPGYPYLGPVDRQHLQYQMEVSQAAGAAPGRQMSGRPKFQAGGRQQAPGLSGKQAALAQGQQGPAEVAGSTHVHVAGDQDAASAWPRTAPPAVGRGLQPFAGAAASDQEVASAGHGAVSPPPGAPAQLQHECSPAAAAYTVSSRWAGREVPARDSSQPASAWS